MNKVYCLIRKGFAAAGIGLFKISNTFASRRLQFLSDLGVTVVLDVGANRGQYASEILGQGYAGRVVSFEPLTVPFEALRRIVSTNPTHACLQFALGAVDGRAEIHVSENLVSSSLLTVSDECLTACHEARCVGAETIEVRRLDTIAPEIIQSSDRIHLKIDTQGTEKDVLLGGERMLAQVVSIELELSLTSLYDNQPLFTEMCKLLADANFRCVWLERGFMNEQTGHTLQVDGFFVRET